MKKLLILFVLFGCSSSQDEKLLEESKEVHEKALEIGQKVKETIALIDDKSDLLEEPTKTSIKDSVKVLSADWEYWDSTIVEVPGHEHDHHDHDHDHDHDHGSSTDLTPEMMLEVQQDLQKRIALLHDRTQKILSTLEEE